ncbi:uncharacterized protein A4U43_C10F15650 [Asparagus officinalis]|uniref:Reverse transcriptase zinc-binding domain-containing protein n=1 Tax=Asparagus officinalis TaxID=4686 RepID=A0A5P1E2Z4_ASPOF|nr:uncharacterized protein A4U43_C10F15650 [Asparagus officinalis]
MWRIILDGRDLIKKGCSWRIENGKSISIWNDIWFDNQSFLIHPPASFLQRIKSVADLIDEASNTWNNDLVMVVFDPTTTESILNTKICSPNQIDGLIVDTLIWKGNVTPSFSSKAIYHILWMDQQPQPSSFNFLSALIKLVMKYK